MTSSSPPGDGAPAGAPHVHRAAVPTPPASLGERMIRILVEERVDDLGKLLHYADLVGSGESMTFPITLDCGFSARITLAVDAVGDCDRGTEGPR